ncbi:MAG: DNA repair protein RadA [Desulfobacterales bacterium]|nr:DNA repair protein RadA [Desulfobacterales bacterium]
MSAQKKKASIFRCSSCGHEETKWLGRCPSCGEWNTLREAAASASRRPGARRRGAVFPAPGRGGSSEGSRLSSGMAEVDRVLGGGVMKGSSVLVGGEPGIGKSTLMLQVAARAGVTGRVLYVSGEESAPRSACGRTAWAWPGRAWRSSAPGPGAGPGRPGKTPPPGRGGGLLQTLRSEEAGSVPGTVNQVKYCALALSEWAKGTGSAVFLVAHVTKEGTIAGPKAAEHMVDAVLYFEQTDGELRFLRAAKNRFGSTDEVGLFTMTETGLAEVADPSRLFLTRRGGAPSPRGPPCRPCGRAAAALLVEIQALTVPAKASLTRVYSDRVDAGRVARIAAVLERHGGLRFSDQDIYVNVAGGMRIAEPGADLAVAAALYSARSGLSLPDRTAVAGELSLAGEVRPLEADARPGAGLRGPGVCRGPGAGPRGRGGGARLDGSRHHPGGDPEAVRAEGRRPGRAS